MLLSRHEPFLIQRLLDAAAAAQSPPRDAVFRDFLQAEQLATIHALGRSRPEVLPYLSITLLDPAADVRLAAASAIDELLKRVRPSRVTALDTAPDPFIPMPFGVRTTLELHDLARFSQLGQFQVAAFNLASAHESGWVREPAVHALAREGRDGRELPFLLVRCNDWVAPVANAAKAAVEARCRQDYAPHFTHNLALVDRLRGDLRVDHSGLLRSIDALLSAPETAPLLLAAIGHPWSEIARPSFRLALQSGHTPVQELISSAIGNSDGALRLTAAHEGCKRLSGSTKAEWVARLCDHRSTQIRRVGLVELATHDPGAALPLLEQALFDSRASIRSPARASLQRLRTDRDFASDYRAVVQAPAGEEPRRLGAAVYGLGETGAESDAPEIAVLADHAALQVRAAAMHALGRLAPRTHFGLFLAGLADESPRVSREAMRSLVSQRDIDLVAILQLARNAPGRHVRLNCLLILARQADWMGFPVLLETRFDRDRACADFAAEQLRRWLRQSYPPTDRFASLDAADDALRRRATELPRQTVRELEFMLQLARRGL